METLFGFLDALAAARPDAEAVACAPHDRVTGRLTWRQLVERSREVARKLIALGVPKGARVGLLCPNRLDWLPIAFGVARSGAVLVPLSTLWKRDEMAYALRHADVDTLLLVPRFLRHDYLQTLGEVAPEMRHSPPGLLFSTALPALRRVVILEGEAAGALSWDRLGSAVSDALLSGVAGAVAPADWAAIFFTSGTTAQAKAVLHTHAALTTSARRLAPCFGITPADAWWGHMPLFWSGGFILGALATMAGGGRLVLQEVVEAGGALALLEAESCTFMAGWHQAGALLEHPDFSRRRLALRKGTYHALAERLLGPDHETIGVYGMSETATCVSASRWSDPAAIRCGTFGKPLEGMELRVVDPQTGRALAAGKAGEIIVKGPTLMEAYYRVPPAETFDADGFFHTGDLGYLDEHGYLHFVGRLKDVIKTAGVNVAAAEVEEALVRHPAVKAAYVVGVPHPARGENIAAFVVVRGAAPSEEEMRQICRANLASYKVPRHFFFIGDEEVPRTASGKVEKAALRRAAAERLEN